MSGFFKVYREQVNYNAMLKNPADLQVWIYLCENARYVRTEQDGIELLPGQLLTSAGEIARTCSLSENQVRKVLDRLAKKGLLSRENIRYRYSLITLLEPDKQPSVQPTATHTTHTINTIQKAIEPPVNTQKSCYGSFHNVFLSDTEKQNLHERSSCADSYIEKLSLYKERTHKKYDNDFIVLCEWICQDDIADKREIARQAALQQHRAQEQPQKAQTTPMTSGEKQFLPPTVSYDLEKIQQIADVTVPVFRKRTTRGI